MLIFKHKNKLQDYFKIEGRHNTKIGFVPTMGSLHEGHLQLIRESTKICELTVCSIFVNPTQFNKKNDFTSYPRDIEKDIKVLRNSTKCDVLYIPETVDLYEKGEKINQYNFNGLEKLMEGIYRPNHFNGVATVLEKFFDIIRPDVAFFGQKDLQQLQIVKRLVSILDMQIKVVGVPTKRDRDGIAMSSRNSLLNNKQREEALKLYASLQYCKLNRKDTVEDLKSHIISTFEKNPMINLDYIEFVDLETLSPIEEIPITKKSAICIAAYVGDVRLIDNIIL
ncbi:MAG: pantoate--beta-alanine ligase [Bacteroidota bacterium]|nr:pantoate--beta-alanine ligase [Bacteroidota bacterium]